MYIYISFIFILFAQLLIYIYIFFLVELFYSFHLFSRRITENIIYKAVDRNTHVFKYLIARVSVSSRLDILIYLTSRRAASVLLIPFPAFTLASSSVTLLQELRCVPQRYVHTHVHFPVALSSHDWRAKENT